MARYKRNFLKQVIARVDFINAIDEINSTVAHSIQDVAVPSFPIIEPSRTVTSIGPRPAEKRMWEFFSRDRSRKLRMCESFMLVEHNRYIDFDELQVPFNKILDQAFLTYDSLSIGRLGLRYVDEIHLDGDPLNWSGYINENLLSIPDVAEDTKTIVRAFHNLEMRKTDYSVRFQYGMWNPDYPSPVMRKNFILDTDVSCTGILARTDVQKLLPMFHDEAVMIFERSIENGLREVMNA